MDFRFYYRIAAALLCLAGPILYNIFHLPVYVYLLSFIGVLSFILMDRKKDGKNR